MRVDLSITHAGVALPQKSTPKWHAVVCSRHGAGEWTRHEDLQGEELQRVEEKCHEDGLMILNGGEP